MEINKEDRDVVCMVNELLRAATGYEDKENNPYLVFRLRWFAKEGNFCNNVTITAVRAKDETETWKFMETQSIMWGAHMRDRETDGSDDDDLSFPPGLGTPDTQCSVALSFGQITSITIRLDLMSLWLLQVDNVWLEASVTQPDIVITFCFSCSVEWSMTQYYSIISRWIPIFRTIKRMSVIRQIKEALILTHYTSKMTQDRCLSDVICCFVLRFDKNLRGVKDLDCLSIGWISRHEVTYSSQEAEYFWQSVSVISWVIRQAGREIISLSLICFYFETRTEADQSKLK